MEPWKLLPRIAQFCAEQSGRPGAFILAVTAILVWAASGPFLGFSDTWQLIINTGTSVVTLMMLFLIQSAQNRDTQAIQLKLDELIRATEGAQNSLIALERESEETLAEVRADMASVTQDVPSGPIAASRSE